MNKKQKKPHLYTTKDGRKYNYYQLIHGCLDGNASGIDLIPLTPTNANEKPWTAKFKRSYK